NTLPFRGTSDVEIAGNVLYIQTGHGGCSQCSYPDGLGIYRSIDSGATWHGIGGPDYWADTRFAVIPSCYGTTIFCSDVDNNLYKAFDTLRPGIANINNPHLAEIIPPAPMKVSPCTSTLATAVIRTAECYKLVILSEKAVGPDSAHFKISKDDFPVIVTSKYHTITISPSSQIDSGTFDAFLHISGYFDYGSFGRENFDTLLPLHLESIGLRPQLSSDKNAIIFSSIDPCTYSTEELLTLRNKGCDTLTVLSGPGELPSQFTYDSITFPFQLAPDEAKTIRFHFTPDSSRLFTANTIFKAEQRGKLQTLVIPIQGEKQKVVPHLEAASSEIFFQNVSMCSPSKDIPVVLKNMGCDTIEVISESDTLSSEFSLDTIALPLRLAPQESLSIMAHFHPSHPGSYYGNISFLSRNGYSKRAISVLLIGSAESSGPMLTVVNGNLEFPLRSTCEPPDDSVITVLNSGCDSMSIISAPGSLPPEFTMDSASFPIPLAAGESHAFHFHFHPTSSGVFSARPKFVAEHFGMQRTVISYIGGKGTEGTAMLRTSPDAIVFPAMTICSESETQVGIITNSGCDTLIVTDVILAEGGSISKSAVDLPMALAPGDSLKYKLLMTPQFKGAITGQISVVAHSAHGTQTSFTSITPISGTVGSGSRTLELSANQIDLGANSLCALRDTSVVIGNSGCDTITITNVTLEGTGFHLRRSDLPIILAPEATAQIGIESEADTMGGKQEASATMTVTSDADNTILPIQLSQKFKLPAKYAIALSGGIKSALPGDTIMLEIRSDADLRGVTTIDLDLELNSDLLGIFKAGGANSATYSDGHLQIRGNPDIISDHGTIATLAMCVYVTKAHSTPIAISAIHLNAFDPSFEECTATASVSGESPIFTTIYPCGGRTLSEFLRNTPAFRINSSYPNPSHDEITLAIESEREQDITITLFDANGKLQLTKVISVTSGKHSVALDLHAIPSGSYITNMTGIQTSSTVRFVKME
ncbi:MAG: T9SS type A sorting domain-containing protein, partial [Bacteroidota bacterium]|nr:T9SS type A sorting domain-containing protein [Bacteroidota bacterium]